MPMQNDGPHDDSRSAVAWITLVGFDQAAPSNTTARPRASSATHDLAVLHETVTSSESSMLVGADQAPFRYVSTFPWPSTTRHRPLDGQSTEVMKFAPMSTGSDHWPS